MLKKGISIQIKDSEYAKALGEYITNYAPDFIASINETNSKEEDHVILVHEGSQSCVVDLCGSRTEALHEKDGYRIFKYSSASSILEELRYIYEVRFLGATVKKGQRNSRVLGFLSAEGGSGCTSIALSCARELSSKSTVLYLSMEPYPAKGKFWEMNMEKEKRTLADYIYYVLHEGKENAVGGYVRSDEFGCNIFNYGEGINDLVRIKASDMQTVFDSILGEGKFDYIIVDFGKCLGESIEMLLKKCRKLFVIYNCESILSKQNDEMLKHLHTNVWEQRTPEVYNIINKCISGSNMFIQSEETKENENVMIPADKDSFYVSNNIINIRTENTFGKGIREILEMVGRDEY